MKTFDFVKFAVVLSDKKEKLSLRQVAKQADVTHVTIQRALLGHDLSINNLVRICGWMGYSVDFFVKEN